MPATRLPLNTLLQEITRPGAAHNYFAGCYERPPNTDKERNSQGHGGNQVGSARRHPGPGRLPMSRVAGALRMGARGSREELICRVVGQKLPLSAGVTWEIASTPPSSLFKVRD